MNGIEKKKWVYNTRNCQDFGQNPIRAVKISTKAEFLTKKIVHMNEIEFRNRKIPFYAKSTLQKKFKLFFFLLIFDINANEL